MLHGVQGGYYWKNVRQARGAAQSLHLRLFRPRAARRISSAGTSPIGGIVYQGDLFPPEIPRPLHRRRPVGSRRLLARRSRRTARRSVSAHGGTLLAANDTWFAPSDVTTGPDGAVYVADWHDARHRPSRSRCRVGSPQRAGVSHPAARSPTSAGARTCATPATINSSPNLPARTSGTSVARGCTWQSERPDARASENDREAQRDCLRAC